jgi:hypothetical protein
VRASLLAIVCLAGCSSGALTIHNPTETAVTVAGFDDPVAVAAGERVRVDRIRAVPALVASGEGGEVARIEAAELPQGGEGVWVLGPGACYAEADYGSYYRDDIPVPPGAQLLGSLQTPGLYVSQGAVDAGPGGTLPQRSRGRAVALVEIPCAAGKAGDAVLTSWLEVALRDIQPK